MHWRHIGIALALVAATVGAVGLASANHPDQNCDQPDNALTAINESADDAAEDNNAVDRAKDECEGDHHEDAANQGGDNADDGRQNAD